MLMFFSFFFFFRISRDLCFFFSTSIPILTTILRQTCTSLWFGEITLTKIIISLIQRPKQSWSKVIPSIKLHFPLGPFFQLQILANADFGTNVWGYPNYTDLMLLSLNITALFSYFGSYLIQIKPIADICNVPILAHISAISRLCSVSFSLTRTQASLAERNKIKINQLFSDFSVSLLNEQISIASSFIGVLTSKIQWQWFQLNCWFFLLLFFVVVAVELNSTTALLHTWNYT